VAPIADKVDGGGAVGLMPVGQLAPCR
jgi:hypothetical protein